MNNFHFSLILKIVYVFGRVFNHLLDTVHWDLLRLRHLGFYGLLYLLASATRSGHERLLNITLVWIHVSYHDNHFKAEITTCLELTKSSNNGGSCELSTLLQNILVT